MSHDQRSRRRFEVPACFLLGIFCLFVILFIFFCVRQASWEETLFTVAQKFRETPAEQKAAIVGGLNDVGE